jgi:hypothetical protein
MERSEPDTDPMLQDASLLDHLRSLTPEERLALNDASMRLALELRASFRARSVPAKPPDDR